MKYSELKILVSGLLIGDNKINKDDDEFKSLLMLAFNDIASRAQSLHLMTMNENMDIIRTAVGGNMTRYPELPELETDELDLDKDLCFVAARFIASYISKNKPLVHKSEAESMILVYNSKVNALLDSIMIDSRGVSYVKN